jgi:hypothetical protein
VAATLTATVQQQTRVLLTLTWPGISTATIQRLDPDGVLRNVRTDRSDDTLVCLGSAVTFDHEAPLDQAVTYQAVSPQGAGATNANIYFESPQNTSNWVGINGGTVAASSTQKHQGAQSLRLTPNGVTAFTGAQADEVNVTPGVVYGWQAWVWATASFSWKVGLQWNTAAHGFISESTTTLTVPTGVWTFFSGSAAAPATAAFAQLELKANGTPAGSNLTYLDEAMVTDPAALTVTSSSVTSPSGGQAWLTHPGHPQYAGTATVTPDGLSELRPARRGIFTPIGASLPIAVSDVRGGSSGTLVVQTNSAADTTRLRNMLADGAPLLLRQPLTWGGDSWWVSIGDAGVDRFTQIATDNWRRWTLPYQRVDRPPGASDGAVGVTWNDVKATYATWNAVTAAKATWTALNQSVT